MEWVAALARFDPLSSSRGGARGLAVVAAPPEVETCIAYATQHGNTARDGTGRNGVFTASENLVSLPTTVSSKRIRSPVNPERFTIAAAYSAHDFRHLYTVTEYRKDWDIYRVSKLLGHVSIQITEIYLRGLGKVD
jgi:site-specific recombinase XerD